VAKVLRNSLLYLLLKHPDFWNIDISQGNAATLLGCGGVFKYDFVTNFLLSLTVKEFWKSVNIWQCYEQEYCYCLCLLCGFNNNNNNNNSHDNVYGAVIMTKVIARVHPVHLLNVDWAPGGHQPSEQANRLGLWVRRKLAAIIHIHHRHCYYYLARRLILILPSHEGWKAEST